MRSLTLSIGGLSTTLNRFTAYDRILAETGQTEYAIVGTPLDSGPQYEPKHIWTISVMATWEEWHLLGSIFSKSDLARRVQGEVSGTESSVPETSRNYRILVEDSVQQLIEVGSRSRAIATGGSETPIGGSVAVAYPAKFYARMFEPKSQWQRNGLYPYIASFTLRELDKVLP